MEECRKIRNREEIPQEDKWALEDLFATDEAWEAELATLAQDQEFLTGFAGKLGQSAETLCTYLSAVEKMTAKAQLLANYCMRKADEDTRDPRYQAMSGRFMSVYVGVATACSFDTPEIMAIPDEALETFYTAYPALERYRRYLTSARRMKPHTLSAAEEKLLTAASEMADAPGNIFTTFGNADLTFPDAVDAKGE